MIPSQGIRKLNVPNSNGKHGMVIDRYPEYLISGWGMGWREWWKPPNGPGLRSCTPSIYGWNAMKQSYTAAAWMLHFQFLGSLGDGFIR